MNLFRSNWYAYKLHHTISPHPVLTFNRMTAYTIMTLDCKTWSYHYPARVILMIISDLVRCGEYNKTKRHGFEDWEEKGSYPQGLPELCASPLSKEQIGLNQPCSLTTLYLAPATFAQPGEKPNIFPCDTGGTQSTSGHTGTMPDAREEEWPELRTDEVVHLSRYQCRSHDHSLGALVSPSTHTQSHKATWTLGFSCLLEK